MADFSEKLGADKEAATFRKLHTGFASRELPTKQIQEEAWKAKAFVAFKAVRIAKSSPDGTDISKELSRLGIALSEALFPPAPGKPPETYVKGLAGNDETTLVIGVLDDAANIAKRAISVVQEFSSSIFKRDLGRAHDLCADELRRWMTPKRFQGALAKADGQFGGAAVECVVERLNLLYADEAARQITNKQGFWPKDTPKTNKRATVGAFWFTHPAERRGRWVALWVTEQEDGYRIAKFQQHLQ